MTVDDALAIIAAHLDARLESYRRRFEDSLIVNHAPPDQSRAALGLPPGAAAGVARAGARQNARRDPRRPARPARLGAAR